MIIECVIVGYGEVDSSIQPGMRGWLFTVGGTKSRLSEESKES